MAVTTPPPQQTSKKEVRSLEQVIGIKKFIFPLRFANECGPDGASSIMVQINSIKHFVPCGIPTDVPENVFAVLKDAGIVSSDESYEVGGPFDPIRNYDQR